MGVAGTTVRRIFELVVLQVGQGVGHVGLAGGDGSGPDGFSVSFDGDGSAHVPEVCAHDEFRTNGAVAQFGGGQVEVVFLFHDVVGEFVADGQAHAPGTPVRGDDVGAGDFGLFSAVVGKGRYAHRLPVRLQDGAAPFVEPFGLDADLAGGGLAAFQAPLEDAHAVGEGCFFALVVHRIPVFRAGHVGEAGAGYQAAGRFVRVVERGEQFPVGLPGVDGVVVEGFVGEGGLDRTGECAALAEHRSGQAVDRHVAVDQDTPVTVDFCDTSALLGVNDLDESHHV